MVPISVNFAGETLRQENIADQMSALIEEISGIMRIFGSRSLRILYRYETRRCWRHHAVKSEKRMSA